VPDLSTMEEAAAQAFIVDDTAADPSDR